MIQQTLIVLFDWKTDFMNDLKKFNQTADLITTLNVTKLTKNISLGKWWFSAKLVTKTFLQIFWWKLWQANVKTFSFDYFCTFPFPFALFLFFFILSISKYFALTLFALHFQNKRQLRVGWDRSCIRICKNRWVISFNLFFEKSHEMTLHKNLLPKTSKKPDTFVKNILKTN